MTLAEFKANKAELVKEMAKAMAETLREMGDSIVHVDWVSYQHVRDERAAALHRMAA